MKTATKKEIAIITTISLRICLEKFLFLQMLLHVSGRINVYLGGQQPNQEAANVGSNVLSSQFQIL